MLCCFILLCFRSECGACPVAPLPVSCIEPNAEEISTFTDCRGSDPLFRDDEPADARLSTVAFVPSFVASRVSYETSL